MFFSFEARHEGGGEDEDQNHSNAHVQTGAVNGVRHRAYFVFDRLADAKETAQRGQEPMRLARRWIFWCPLLLSLGRLAALELPGHRSFVEPKVRGVGLEGSEHVYGRQHVEVLVL